MGGLCCGNKNGQHQRRKTYKDVRPKTMLEFEEKYHYTNLYEDSVIIDKFNERVFAIQVIKKVDKAGVPMTDLEERIMKGQVADFWMKIPDDYLLV